MKTAMARKTAQTKNTRSNKSQIDRPQNWGSPQMNWGSDVVAETTRRLNLKYIALVPGASYRGFHDSIVNYLGNENPQMVICLHEEHADLQRLVRPHADDHLRRHRPRRRASASAVDRLDPHLEGSSGHRARLHQVGRSAGLAAGSRRVGAAGQPDHAQRAPRAGLYLSRRRSAGSAAD